MKKIILTTAFAVYAVLGFAQTPYWSYGFENGALTDGIGNDDLVQNGSALTTVNDRFSSANDAVILGGDHLVGGTTGADSYSISFWINDVVNDANQRMVVNDYLNSYGYYIVLLNGNLRAYAKFGYTLNNQPYAPSSPANLTTTVNVADGNWHHVAFTAREFISNGYDYSYEYKLYIDGVQVASDIRVVYISNANNNRDHHGLSASHTFAVGDDATNSSSFKYENTIDDIVFYKEDLTAAEVTAIYNARQAQTIYVDKDATGANDGTSWADAFTSLKDATDYATEIGDEIWVAEGIYKPHTSSRSTSFTMNTGVALYGGFNGTETAVSQRDWRANEVVLSGDLSGNDNSNVGYTEATRSDNSYNVVVVNGSNTLIDGVTISGGQANHASTAQYKAGGAVYKAEAVNSIDIQNCIIEKNTAYYQGGISASFASSDAHSISFTNSIFRENVSKGGSAFTIVINAGTATATVANCLMANNTAMDYPGSPGFTGSAGLFVTAAGTLNASLINCTVADNHDTGTSTVSVDPAPIGVRRSGGTLDFNASNNIFHNNNAALSFGRYATINCPTSVVLSNNIRPDVATPFCSATSTSESSLAATLDANYRPTAGSSSIDAGDNAVAVGTYDIDGNDRVLDGTIDIGAFEYNATACSPITQQPVTTAGCIGDDVSLTVGTTGTILSYQWKFNGVDIPGETSATLDIIDLQGAQTGSYTVDVEAACGTVTSNTALVLLNATYPIITQQPADAAQCETDDLTIEVVATGNGLTYQWQKGGVDVIGETSSSLFFDGIDAAEAGNYTVIVDGTGVCLITSDVAVVTVNTAPTITQQPTNQVSCLGGNASFTASASGASLTQWYKNGTPMAGELSTTLTFANLIAGDAGTYHFVASNSCGVLYSDAVQLNIGSTTTVTLQPVSAAQCEGTGAQFISQATGTNLSYQWRLNGVDIAGANGQVLNVNTIDQSDAGAYTLEFTGACGTEVSDAAVLEVNAPAAIATFVSDATECVGEDASFTVSATGYNLSYQWSDQSGILTGETNATLDLTSVQLADAGLYSVEVDGQCGSAVVSSGTLIVNALPTPTITENLGMLETGVFDTYQWYIDGNSQNGETNASIAITVSGDYTVEVTDNGCEGTSSPYNVITVGIDEQAATIVAAYPNPFTDVVTLEVADFAGPTEVSVIDMTGRTVFTSIETASNVQLNLEHLSSGTYGLIVRGENGKTAMSRLIKN